MKNAVYKLFAECFPQLEMTEDIFCRLLDFDRCKIILRREGDTPAGCAAVCGNCIRLICVTPEFRGRGIGGELLQRSEEIIAENGFDSVVVGGVDSNLFIGAVTSEEQWKNKRNAFFERSGYRFDDSCLEMRMSLADFDSDSLDIPKCPENVSFGYISEDRRQELHEAVAKVDEDWVRYFDFGSPVFAAEADGKIVGFCINDVNAETIISNGKNNVGMIGCVGVIPEMRKNGIGLEMVKNSVIDLKNRGCGDIFIHYTYLDRWYGRLGFKTFLRYLFGKKEL